MLLILLLLFFSWHTPGLTLPGTWIPLAAGQALAQRNNIYDRIRPIFDFKPGAESPPPAPRHASKPKTARKPPAAATASASAPLAPSAVAVAPAVPQPASASRWGMFGVVTIPQV